jgi:hypothetical protein
VNAAVAAITGTVLLTSAVPAAAETIELPMLKKGPKADRALASAAYCIANAAPDRAAGILNLDPQERAATEALLDLFRNQPFCAAGLPTTKAPVITWRGALAEALYLDRFKSPMPGPAAEAARQPEWFATTKQSAYAVAQCAAERSPAAADALVRAKRRSPEELGAVNALLPALRSCGKGRKVDFDRDMIHGLVAEDLFRVRGGIPQGTK